MQESQLLINSASHLFELNSRWKNLEAASNIPKEDARAGPITSMEDDLRERSTKVFAMPNVKKLNLTKSGKSPKVLFIVMDAY